MEHGNPLHRRLGQKLSRIFRPATRGEGMSARGFDEPITPTAPVYRHRSLEEAISMGSVTPPSADWRDLLDDDPLTLPGNNSVSQTLQRLRRDER